MSEQKPKISKKEQRRQQVAREKRNRNLRIAIPVGLIVLALAGFVIFRAVQPEIEGVVQVPSAPGANHDDTLQLDFGGLPPMGGPHASRWQNCGIYLNPVLPQNAIHSMEHGVVWITYHPDLSQEEVAVLQDVAQGQPKILLSPYPDQEAPIVLTVWDRQLVLESAADERIEAFIGRYRGRTGPEANASCTGGIGVPAG